MKYSVLLVKFIHYQVFILFTILFILFIDYSYIPYCIVFYILVLINWYSSNSCLILEYENFMICQTDENCNIPEDKYDGGKITLKWYIMTHVVVVALLLRYIYQFNFFNVNGRYTVQLFMLFMLLLMCLLFIPSILYYKKSRKSFLFLMYLFFFCCAVYINYIVNYKKVPFI